MKYQIRFLLLQFFVASLLLQWLCSAHSVSAQNRPPRDPDLWKWIDSKAVDNCEHHTLHSPSMKRAVGYSIYLPPSYATDTDKRFSVVYYLHGAALGDRGRPGTQDTASLHLKKNIDSIRGKTGLWMAVGTVDSLFKGNREFSKQLTELGVKHQFQTLPDVGHQLGALNDRFHREIVVMLDKHYAAAK